MVEIGAQRKGESVLIVNIYTWKALCNTEVLLSLDTCVFWNSWKFRSCQPGVRSFSINLYLKYM